MAINQPPIQEKTSNSFGLFPQVWIRWFQSVFTTLDEISNGYGADGVMDGGRRTTGAALFDGGRRV